MLPLSDEDQRHDEAEGKERAERRAERYRQRVGRRRALDTRARLRPPRHRQPRWRLAGATGSRLTLAQHADVVVGVLVQLRDVVGAGRRVEQARRLHYVAADRLILDLELVTARTTKHAAVSAADVIIVEFPTYRDRVF